MADKEGVTLSLEEEDGDVALAYRTPEKKSLQEIQQLDPDDESLRKYKQALLGAIPMAVDARVPNVQVMRLTLLCEQAPGPMIMDLTGDLEALRSRSFVLKEGVDYRVKVSFKVRLRCRLTRAQRRLPSTLGALVARGSLHPLLLRMGALMPCSTSPPWSLLPHSPCPSGGSTALGFLPSMEVQATLMVPASEEGPATLGSCSPRVPAILEAHAVL
ncbi:PREDICTED: rho GDP-dissociation inhibitor 3-like [Tinamus guttatus]|uniref:rho GDP-dissociation inhibitor 3-like n=1 Tax=Tinamus guttatus TaxID=94827 RepID=UPI00052EAD80|nr:PREDICTED: rho GDP-dissociation inhibitor 3-like [Tinamus guttatus]